MQDGDDRPDDPTGDVSVPLQSRIVTKEKNGHRGLAYDVPFVFFAIVVVSLGFALLAGQQASEVEVHLREACVAAWPDGTKARVKRCVVRAMAAMGAENRLRDNELKRFLLACEKELKACVEAANPQTLK